MSELIKIDHESIEQFYLQISHYSTPLDEDINLDELKENIENIFSKNFDNFFSDLYPEILGGKKIKLSTKIQKNDSGFEVIGLDGIKLDFTFNSLNNIKSVDIAINFKNSDLTDKHRLYLNTIFGYLKEFGLELNFIDSHFSGINTGFSNITCKDGICNFVQNIGDNLIDINDTFNTDILKALQSDNFIFLNNLNTTDKKLNNYVYHLKRLKKESYAKKPDSEEAKKYNTAKLNLIFYVVSSKYKKLIVSLNAYISSINKEINNRDTNNQVNEILEKGNIEDKTVFLQVKILLERYKDVYTQKFLEIEKQLDAENSKKNILSLGIELGQEIPVIIKKLEKKIPLPTRVKTYFSKKSLKVIEEQEKKIEEETQNNNNFDENTFNNIKEFIDRGLNYQLFENDIWENIDESIDILCIIDGEIITNIKEIPEEFSKIINRDIIKYAKVHKENEYKIINLETKKISEVPLGEIKGNYIDIKGNRYIQLGENYVSLDTLNRIWITINYDGSYVNNIDTSKTVTINGKKYFYTELSEGNDFEARNLYINFEDINIDKNGIFRLEDSEDFIIDDIDIDKQYIINNQEYKKILRYKKYSETKWKYINLKNGEFLESEMKELINTNVYLGEFTEFHSIKKIEGNNIYIKISKKSNWRDDDIYTVIYNGRKFLKYNDFYISNLGEKIKKGKMVFYKANVIEITINPYEKGYNKYRITEYEKLLNNEFGILTFNGRNIKFGNKSFKFKGNIYQEIITEQEKYFIKLGNERKEYDYNDVFKYKQDGKTYEILEGYNKGDILELKLIDKDGEITFISIEDSNGKETMKDKFFNLIK